MFGRGRPPYDQLGDLLKSSPTSEQSLLIEAGQKFVLEEILRRSLGLVLRELEALFTNLGDIPSDWKDKIQTRKAEQVDKIIKAGPEPKGLADRIRVAEGILEKVSVAAKAAFKRAVAVDSLQKLVIDPLKKFEERITRYKCYVSSLQGANVALNKLSVTENKALPLGNGS